MRTKFLDFVSMMDGVVAVHTDTNPVTDQTLFWAYHPSFDEVAQGEDIPFYVGEVTTTSDGEFNVTWKKLQAA